MKRYKNKAEYFTFHFEPEDGKDPELFNLLNIYSQNKFNRYLSKKPDLEIEGEVTEAEEAVIKAIKSQIGKLLNSFPDVKPERLEFDLARILYSNLKELGFGRYHTADIGMWRWLSMNYFKDETFWRRGKSDFEKREYAKAAKATFEHCIGKRSRDIFPRRYFMIGQRLYDANEKFSLIEKLAEKSRAARSGGFGNLIANLIETKLISPNDHVAKMLSKVLFVKGEVAEDKEVARAFVRYNGFKRRLLNTANEDVFEKEICIG